MKLRKILYSLSVIPLVVSLSSCFDLGNYENEKAYVDFFEVYVTDGNSVETYEMSDFYSGDSSEFILPAGFQAKEYKYLALKVKEDLKVGNIAIFCSRGNDETTPTTMAYLTINVSVADAIPSHFINLDDNYTALENYYNEKAEDLLHPDPENPKDWSKIQPTFASNDEPTSHISQDSVKIKKGDYNNAFFEDYNGDESFTVLKDKYILFEFENNTDTGVVFDNTTTLEAAQEMIEIRRAARTKITFTDFLIEGL